MAEVGKLIHADWSLHARKRWAAFANRKPDGTVLIERIARFTASPASLLQEGECDGVLIGFDFPIGLPKAYAQALKIARFPDFLGLLASDMRFANFALPAESSAAISAYRPFYPARPGGTSRSHLVAAHAVTSFNDLLRECELKTLTRPAACSLFWTLGGNQVGRAAAAGWLEVLTSLSADPRTRFWPFDGRLDALTSEKRVTVVETYPAEAMRYLGVSDGKRFSKRRQSDRLGVVDAIWAASQALRLTFADSVEADIACGFGEDSEGEDRFDALIGLLGMARVLAGLQEEGGASDPIAMAVEGWIFGQKAAERLVAP